MRVNSDITRRAGLIWLLVYQWVLVLVAVVNAYAISVDFDDVLLGSLILLVLACWGAAMGFASVGMMRLSSQGFLVGMICHLLLAILALLAVFGFLSSYMYHLLTDSKAREAMVDMFLLYALMLLPFASVSAWAFCYLRKLRD